MKKSDLEKIHLFCSVSLNQIEEINQVLIPSIINQKCVQNIELTLINYNADNKIKPDKISNREILKINILNPSNPVGFGEAFNFAFKKIKPEKFFILINPDTYLHNITISELISSFNNNIAIVEARQLPFSHPKDPSCTDIVETNWSSGSCTLIDSKFFKSVNGFDPNYWMYLEDVDLSWKAWIAHYKVIHNPKAIVYHFTGVYFRYHPNSYEIEDFWSMRNFLYISYVYWGERGLNKAKTLLNKSNYNNEIKKEAIKSFEKLKNSKTIKHIKVPNYLKNKIKIFGYNKFSELP